MTRRRGICAARLCIAPRQATEIFCEGHDAMLPIATRAELAALTPFGVPSDIDAYTQLVKTARAYLERQESKRA